ncbi:hypothetical protein BD414DRAFT_384954, partial [Trametes punicea]
MSSAGPSRPRVITLTADQLLGSSLTPARPHKQPKDANAPRVLTIEDLLGPGLTVARPTPKPPAPKPAARPAPRSASRPSSSARSTPNPRLVRVTADEVLRTGIPVRTLQVVKARSGQARVLTAEELLAAGSSHASARRTAQSRHQSRGRTAVSEPSAGPSSPPSIAGASGSNVGQTGGSSSVAESSRRARERPGMGSTGSDAQGAAAPTRTARSGQSRRSNSLGSMRTLPMYTQEPGESEVVIDRGAAELEDDETAPITAISPVEETEPDAESPVHGVPASPPSSPTHTGGIPLSSQASPVDAVLPSVASSLPNHLPPWLSVYSEAAPSYEAAMSTPNLHMYLESPAHVPLSSPPSLGPMAPSSPAPASASTSIAPSAEPAFASHCQPPAERPMVRIHVQSSPSVPAARPSPSPRSPGSPSTSTPSSPGEQQRPDSGGAETPRRRFGFMAIFRSRSSSRLRAHLDSHSLAHSDAMPQTGARERSHARTGSASAVPSPQRVASPDRELLAPAPRRPFHRLAPSASGSMLDLLSRSRS